MTEKEIEEWLVLERHDITLPDGTIHSINADRVFWNAFNFIRDYSSLSMEDVVRLTRRTMISKNCDFEAGLKCIITAAYREIMKPLS
ncbi:MAG: hypothetical protein R3D71_08310 [Rickettsiales bacterium]